MKRPTKIQRWWYRRGHRPKNGSWLYSPSLAVQYAAMEALLGVKHHIREAQRRMNALTVCGAIYPGAPWSRCYVEKNDHGPMHQAYTHYPGQVVSWPV